MHSWKARRIWSMASASVVGVGHVVSARVALGGGAARTNSCLVATRVMTATR